MAILALDPQSGNGVNVPTLELFRTRADCANKTALVTSALTQAQSNITGPWPADRALKVEKGGKLANSTAFVINGASYVSAEWWGLSAAAADNHDAIMSAVNCAVASGGIPVKFPQGTFKTSPLSFLNLNNVKLEGVGGNLYKENTRLQIIAGTGDVGLQFASTENPMTLGEYNKCSKYSTVDKMIVDVNNTENIGINGNLITLTDVTVLNAIQYGIQLEDNTYPSFLHYVDARYNGLAGLRIRGPLTTKYKVTDSEFSYNSGYGIIIEGGAGAAFDHVNVQTNAVGGIKIYYPDYPSTQYLEAIGFREVYSELNGTIGFGNPGYEGDYALVVDSYETALGRTNSASNLLFANCAFNKSAAGLAVNLNRVNGYHFVGGSPSITYSVLGTSAFEGYYGIGTIEASAPWHVRKNGAFDGGELLRLDTNTKTTGASVYQTFFAQDSADASTEYARITAKIVSPTAGSRVGKVEIKPIAMVSDLAANRASIVSIVGTTGGYTLFAAENTATLSGATTVITLNIPTGVRLVGAQLRVDTLITASGGGVTWGAAYSGGATTALTNSQSFTKNVKVNTIHTEAVTTGTTNVTISATTGLFTGGVVRAIVYYESLATMADMP